MEFDDLEKQWDKTRKEIDTTDAMAKSKGVFVGRKMYWQVYDGYALYVIESFDNKGFHLKHINIYDGYTEPVIELFNRTLPYDVVKKYFQQRGS